MNGFSIENLPYGAFERGGAVHLGVAFEDRIFDLHAAADAGLFDGVCDRAMLCAPVLNDFLQGSVSLWHAVRTRLQTVLREVQDDALFEPRKTARMHLPIDVGDYVDFYSSENHARNLGRIFRPNAQALLPNWKWLPVGYHGRSGGIVISGTPVRRPHGQRKAPDEQVPAFGPSEMLDFELEIGFVTGVSDIFGVVLVNDWSARDIQAWEYQPLGPFLGKAFATTISPWIVPLEALAPFRVVPLPQDPQPLPHLCVESAGALDIALEILLQSARMREQGVAPVTISRTNARELYWTMEQQLAHVRGSGARVRAGDFFASGTISGNEPATYGSLIELTWRGTEPLELPGGEQRRFLEDGDEVTLLGRCERDGAVLDLGDCRGRVEG